MGSIPSIVEERERLTQIDGTMPRLNAIPDGCAFHPRCAARGRALPAASARSSSRSARRARPAGSRGGLRPVAEPLLELTDVARTFDVSPPWLDRVLERKPRALLKAVDGVSLAIARGETLGLVGESGCGKSTVARLIVGLYAPTRGHDRVRWRGRWRAPGAARRRGAARGAARHADDLPGSLREPQSALARRRHRRRADPRARARRRRAPRSPRAWRSCWRRSGSPLPTEAKYPHQFSGGQRQRISIARALSTEPRFLVCDEPTSALDVSVQAQVLNLMRDLQRRLGLTYLFISHNLAVVHHIADRVGVMYLGRIVELAPTKRLFAAPQHPYTRMLLAAVPDLAMTGRSRARRSPAKCPIRSIRRPGARSIRAARTRTSAAGAKPRARSPRAAGGEVACHAVEEDRLGVPPPLTA